MGELLCFQHCNKDSNIFCFCVPKDCPICGTDLSAADLRIPPFRVPLPFTRARENVTSIVIKPTTGNFLKNFKNGDLLHVGITNSEGKIFEFDENGLQASTGIEWDDCLAIKIGNDVNSYALDQALNEAMLSTTWINSNYNEETNNCFDFVTSILNRISEEGYWTKNIIVTKFVSPSINKAIRTIALYRKTEEKGIHFSTVDT